MKTILKIEIIHRPQMKRKQYKEENNIMRNRVYDTLDSALWYIGVLTNKIKQ